MGKLKKNFFIALYVFVLVAAFQNCGTSFQAVKGSFYNTPIVFSMRSMSTNAPTGEFAGMEWDGADPVLRHNVGTAVGSAWQVAASDTAGYLNYGPYIQFPAAGSIKAQFRIKALNNAPSGRHVLLLDVFSSDLNRSVASREVWPEEFNENDTQIFSLTFKAEPGRTYEFRSSLNGGGMGLRLEKVAVTTADQGVLGDFFSGRKVPAEIGALTSAEGWMYVQDGVWYHFVRDFLPESQTPNFCHLGPDARSIGIGVRISRDKGRTWSATTRIATPSGIRGRDDACSVLDGTTFYNSNVSAYQILSQCIGEDGSGWRLCLFQSPTLTGVYSRVPGVSIAPRQIANMACQSGTTCAVGQLYDEGTPEFVGKKLGHYYFTFHAYDGVRGYRILARTIDFNSWQAHGAGLAGDSVFSPADCAGWDYQGNGPCVGAGAASTLESGDFTYMLVEAPTKNLDCKPDQYWPIGLVRSHQIERSMRWESSVVNPVIKPVAGVRGCAIQYARLFRDGEDVYLYYTRFTQPNYAAHQIPLLYVGKDVPQPTNSIPRSTTTTTSPSADSIFVESQYLAILKRKPAANETEYYVNRLQAGSITRTYITAHFNDVCATRQEPCGVVVQAQAQPTNNESENYVRSLYLSILKRDPTPQEVQYYVGRLADGSITRTYISAHFNAVCANGQETCGQSTVTTTPTTTPTNMPTPTTTSTTPAPVVLSDVDFVNAIYLTILKRPADQSGLNFFVAELQAGRMTRDQVQAHFYRVCRSGVERCGR